jgi:glucokinase
MILAGDIGGTKTVIAHYEESGGGLRQLRTATFHSKDYQSLEGRTTFQLLGNLPGLDSVNTNGAACGNSGKSGEGISGLRDDSPAVN